jgi:hypothetical protein
MSKFFFYKKRELKFPKFVKDKELISLLKGMLTKNSLKRILNLKNVKTHEYFKDFNWENLLSFNLEACYNIDMPQETLKTVSSYSDYITEHLKEFKPPKDSKVDSEYKEKVDVWFNSF